MKNEVIAALKAFQQADATEIGATLIGCCNRDRPLYNECLEAVRDANGRISFERDEIG